VTTDNDDDDDDVKVCAKCCTNDHCNTHVLRGLDEAGAANLVMSISLLALMAALAMLMQA